MGSLTGSRPWVTGHGPTPNNGLPKSEKT